MPLGGAAWIGDEGHAAGHDELAALDAPLREEARYSKRGSGDFNRKLIYPKVGF